MTRKISSMRPEERLQHVSDLLRSDELNRAGGSFALTVPVLVTYEAVRGITARESMRARVVGLSYDVARLAHSLVVVEEREGRLKTIPLTTLISVEPETKES